ncbi:uncharacterized protein UTRI_04654_B [Ustilago trichophora]|uniref:Uncharacterized protein n=1 Tax=Ustilago trichophora TaxID=86804 RepID=A0A5C3ECU9_9BASI|nr:uncharacterized protein UTRI_04654_B [Ustilago trichophora]
MILASIHSWALFGLLSFPMLLSLIYSVDAHEDPFVIAERQNEQLRQLRRRYQDVYFASEGMIQPTRHEILDHYPASITNVADRLQHFGTLRWNPSEHIIALLETLNHDATTLLATPFHPNLVESQRREIREQHDRTFTRVADWIHNHRDVVEGLEGSEEALNRFRKIRDLAEISARLHL